MHISKLPTLVLLLVLFSGFIFLVNPTIAHAGALNPTFGITVLDKNPGVTSDMEFNITNPIGSELPTSTKINFPTGWEITPGDKFLDGSVMGSGSFTATFDIPRTFHFQVLNSTDLQGHVAHLVIEFTDTLTPVTLDDYIDGNSKDGYILILNPAPGGIALSLPTETIFTLKGAPDGVAFLTNSQLQGDYAWVADFSSVLTGGVSKTDSINIPTSKTPIGTDVGITLSNGAEVVFANVSVGGLTTIDTQVEAPPAGTGQFQISPDGLYYDYNSTATFECPCLITLPYDPKTTPKPAMYHLNTKVDPAVWEDITVKVDEVNYTITGETSSFSFFTVGAPNYNVLFGKQITKLIAKKGNPFSISGDESLNIKFNLLDNSSVISSPDGVGVQIWQTKDANGNNITPVKVSTINAKSNKKGDYQALLNLEKSRIGIGTFEIRIIVGTTEASQVNQVLFRVVGHVDDETRNIIDSERD